VTSDLVDWSNWSLNYALNNVRPVYALASETSHACRAAYFWAVARLLKSRVLVSTTDHVTLPLDLPVQGGRGPQIPDRGLGS